MEVPKWNIPPKRQFKQTKNEKTWTWLVVYLPLWKIWKSVGSIISKIWKIIIHSCSSHHQPFDLFGGLCGPISGFSDSLHDMILVLPSGLFVRLLVISKLIHCCKEDLVAGKMCKSYCEKLKRVMTATILTDHRDNSQDSWHYILVHVIKSPYKSTRPAMCRVKCQVSSLFLDVGLLTYTLNMTRNFLAKVWCQ